MLEKGIPDWDVLPGSEKNFHFQTRPLARADKESHHGREEDHHC